RFITDYMLSEHVSQVLIDNKGLADFFESAVKVYSSPKEIANWIVSDLMGFIGENYHHYRSPSSKEEKKSELKVEAKHIAELGKLMQLTKGRADPKIALEIIKKKLIELD